MDHLLFDIGRDMSICGAVFSALLKSKSFQDMVRSTMLEGLRSSEGQQLLAKAVCKELRR